MASGGADKDFPCSLIIKIPFPSHRLASAAIRTLSVDQELSPLVKRSFSLVNSTPESSSSRSAAQNQPSEGVDPPHAGANRSRNDADNTAVDEESRESHLDTPSDATILKTVYQATTNRMLRVAVNGFFESLGTVIQVMEELDLDVVHEKGIDVRFDGVQGIEYGQIDATTS